MFKQLKEFPDYIINEEAEVRKLKTGLTLKRTLCPNRVLVTLRRPNGSSVHKSLRKLMAETFFDEDTYLGKDIQHLDDDIANCAADNLMFVDFPTTVKYNAKKDPTIAVLDENAFYLNSYKTIKEAADSLGVKVSIIRQSLNYNKSIQDITSLLPTLAQWGKLAFLVDYKQAKDNGWLVEQEEYIDEDSCIQE